MAFPVVVVPVTPPDPPSRPTPRTEDEHEVTSLRAVFRARRLSVATMERPLRLATVAALLSVAGVAVLIALRDVKAPSVSLGQSAGVSVQMPLPLFIATLVLLSVGLGYLLTGAVLASLPVAVASLVLITGMIGIETGAFGRLFSQASLLALLPAWAQWSSRGLLAGLWLVAALVWLRDARGGGTAVVRRLRPVVLMAYIAIFAGYFAILRVAAPTTGGLNVFPQVVGLLMVDVVLLVYPVLLVAAVDFGEWGGLLGARAASALHGRGRWLVLFAAVLSAGLVAFGYAHLAPGTAGLSTGRLWRLGRGLLILSVALALILAVGRAVGAHRRHWPATLNFAAIFAVCAVGSYLIAPLSGIFADDSAAARPPEKVSESGEFTAAADTTSVTGGSADAIYSLLIPHTWLHNATPGPENWSNYVVPGLRPGAANAAFERVVILAVPAKGNAAEVAAAAGLHPSAALVVDGPWTVVPFTSHGIAGLLRARPGVAAPGTTYVLEELANVVPLSVVRPELDAVARSFRTAGEPAAGVPEASKEAPSVASQHTKDRTQLAMLIISVGLCLVLLTGAAVFGRRWPARVLGTVLLFALVTGAAVLYFADAVGRVWGGPGTRWPYVSQYDLLAGVGALGLLALIGGAWRPVHNRRQLAIGLIALDATVWALQGMGALYDHALSASRVSAWAAIIVLVAVGWDVTMSGESMTNHGSHHAPRATRVLAFLGYVILLSATVLFYSAQHEASNGKAAEAFFEPELVTRNGLFRIALPVAVLLFLLRFGRSRSTTQPVAEPAP